PPHPPSLPLPDALPISSTPIACDGAACAGWHTAAPVSVTLDAADTASGVTQIRYTTDGGDPTLLSGQAYLGAFDVSQTTTVKFRAWDTVGNAEPVATEVVHVDASAPSLSVTAASP